MKVIGALIFLISVFVFLGPIRQDQAYHGFADARNFFSIPNALNVLSNLAFLLSAHAGLYLLAKKHKENRAYLVLFVSIIFIALGSSYYHWNPNDKTLIWDRLPMTIAFMAVLSIVISEKLDRNLGKKLLEPLILIGILSLIYWVLFDDLRMYILVQAAPLISTPYFVFMYPDRYTHTHYMNYCAYFYAASKVCEFLDASIFEFTLKTISGHTLKHLLAALGLCFIPLMLSRRTLVQSLSENLYQDTKH